MDYAKKEQVKTFFNALVEDEQKHVNILDEAFKVESMLPTLK